MIKVFISCSPATKKGQASSCVHRIIGQSDGLLAGFSGNHEQMIADISKTATVHVITQFVAVLLLSKRQG